MPAGQAFRWTNLSSSCFLQFAHPGEKARRRDPAVHSYAGIACPEMKKVRHYPSSLPTILVVVAFGISFFIDLSMPHLLTLGLSLQNYGSLPVPYFWNSDWHCNQFTWFISLKYWLVLQPVYMICCQDLHPKHLALHAFAMWRAVAWSLCIELLWQAAILPFVFPDAHDCWQVGLCSRGDQCSYAHNVFEYWMHPARWCFFHSESLNPVITGRKTFKKKKHGATSMLHSLVLISSSYYTGPMHLHIIPH